MINKYTRIKNIIFPSKKINFTVISILILGVISGAIFSNIIDLNDENVKILYQYVTYGTKGLRNDKFVNEDKVIIDSFSNEEKLLAEICENE